MSVPRQPKQLNIRVRDNRRIEFFMLPNDLIDLHAAKIGAYATLAYVALCRYAGSNTDATVSYTTLAARLGVSRPTLAAALKRLASLGYVTVEHTTSAQGRGVNIYTIERLPVSKARELTRESTSLTNPRKPDEPTLVNDANYIKEEDHKDEERKEPAPNLKRIQEWSQRHPHKRSR